MYFQNYGRIRLSVSTIKCTCELSGITHVTPSRGCGKHSTGPSTNGPWVRTYSKLFLYKSVLTACSYRAQSNGIWTYGMVSRGFLPRFRMYGLLYLRTVEYDLCYYSEFSHLATGVNTCISVLELLFISLTHSIYRIRYGWQWHIRYIQSFQQYMTSPSRFLVINCCHCHP